MELFIIKNVCWLFSHLEDMIDVDSFSIRYVIYIIHEWFQFKSFLMEHFNNFNIIAGIQKF